MDAREMRESWDSFQAYKKDVEKYATVKLCPVRTWFDREYIVVGDIKLIPETQVLDVIDVTGDHDVARFSAFWPQHGTGTHALVIFPHEGSIHVLLEDGYEYPVYFAVLPVQVISPSREDARAVLDEVDEYDVAQIDAGSELQIR